METEKTYRKHTHSRIRIEIVLHGHKKQKERKTCFVYFYQALLLPIMDHFPTRQTFEFGKSINTAGKSILHFIQLSSLVAKYCKMWKIPPRKVCDFYILFYYLRKIKRYHYVEFTTKLHNFTKFRKGFLIVLKLFSNLKVCLIGEWSSDGVVGVFLYSCSCIISYSLYVEN